jgi:hypothetical protein
VISGQVGHVWNRSGTNAVRIADSVQVQILFGALASEKRRPPALKIIIG